ncbi:hypothetical protein E5D54_08085 [Escherichia coli]|uniref:hypothetical protein n=1 Tax=Escherichia coli TaxID=562 RepID=UPI000BB471B5|nr:hypothetical protein [Escherichia coli]ATC02972.1 hypothetical protein CNQ50_13550 [Escherichia coli]MDI4364547.1 hypothetical protein [Escherichia coli]MDI4393797.1 hypothetical protein [Escherichia coli]MDI4476072.1 hypothetical protein [Escherichia coli]HAM7080050.1 hypothetical protein [Escherichia coli]
MIEDGIYGVNLMENVFYMVEGDTVTISVDGGEEYAEPFIKTTREDIERYVDKGELFKLGEL